MTKFNDQYGQIFYTKEGNGNGVLFLHGWGCDHTVWNKITPSLSKNNCVMTVDFLGFGQSDKPTKKLTVFDYCENIANFITQQKCKKLTVVGHSFGGRVAVLLGAKYPQLVDKIVLVDSAGLKRFSLVLSIKVLLHKIKKWLVKIKVLNKKCLESDGSSDFKTVEPFLRDTFLSVINTRLDDYARQITASTLLIWGKNDKETPYWIGKKYNKLIHNSALVTFNNCGHFPFLSQQSKFIAVINSFVNG